MAPYAESHLEVHLLEPVPLGHVPVALGAIQSKEDMRLVVEVHMVWHIIDSHPRHWCLVLIVPSFLLNLRMLRNYMVVAKKTLLHLRKTRPGRSVHKRVTEPTADLLHPSMNSMTEMDGLFHPQSFMGKDVVQI